MIDNVSIITAFSAGVISFISPCVLPLIPSYISFITGISFEELSSIRGVRRALIVHSALFVLGFSIIFIGLGASATFIGKFLMENQEVIRRIGGIIIIIIGIHMTGIINIKFLERERRVYIRDNPKGYVGSLLVGIGFAAGWTPCIGPILGAIIFLAGTSKSIWSGIFLLSAYSLGLGLPFFLTAVGINRFIVYFDKFKGYMRYIPILSGIFLIFIGILIYTDYFSALSGYMNSIFPYLNNI